MWINFGGEDIGAELRKLNRNMELLMAAVQVDQTVLDAIGTELSAVADAVQAIVDNPDVPLGAADLAPITAPLARIQDALTEPETPVEPAPPAEEAPVDEAPTPE